MSGKKIFVTVGTTNFDALINIMSEDEVLKELNKKGYDELIMQIGKTALKPDCEPRCGFKTIQTFNTKPFLVDHIKHADLIISHAGAGTCLEVLENQKPLIVVINYSLMDNHQAELAKGLHENGYLLFCTHLELLNLFQKMDLSSINKFTYDKSKKISNSINALMGFNQ